MNRIEFVSIRFYLHLIVTLAAEVEDRLGSGEVGVGVGGQAGQAWQVGKAGGRGDCQIDQQIIEVQASLESASWIFEEYDNREATAETSAVVRRDLT